MTPPPGELRGSQAERRQRIVDEAFAMLQAGEGGARRGREVHIREVAERAGVAVGTAYRYFGSKDRLFAEAFQTWVERHAVEIERSARRGRSNLARTKLLACGLFDIVCREPQFLRLNRRLRTSEEPEVQRIVQACDLRLVALFQTAVRGVAPTQLYSIGLIVTSLLMSSLERVVCGWTDQASARRDIDHCLATVFDFHDTGVG